MSHIPCFYKKKKEVFCINYHDGLLVLLQDSQMQAKNEVGWEAMGLSFSLCKEPVERPPRED